MLDDVLYILRISLKGRILEISYSISSLRTDPTIIRNAGTVRG
jgi:hypothetical protein